LQNLPSDSQLSVNQPKLKRLDGFAFADGDFMNAPPKRFVYVLQSLNKPDRHYTGLTSDMQHRLLCHNKGASSHTAADRPWQITVVLEFRTEDLAIKFERYLKSGSGRAFAKKHF
jgi:putative endonuclease